MSEPLSFQAVTNLSGVQVAGGHSGLSWGSGFGSALHPRRIEIQIQRASNMVGNDRAEGLQPSAQTNPSINSGGENYTGPSASRSLGTEETGAQVLPFQMVAAAPTSFNQVGSESQGHSVGIYYPVVGRLQQVTSSENVLSERPPHSSSEQYLAAVGSGRTSISDSISQLHNSVEGPERDGCVTETRDGEPISRDVSISIVSSSMSRHNQENSEERSGSMVEFLRALFPCGDVNAEEASVNGVSGEELPQDVGTPSAEPSVREAGTGSSDDGILLSNFLRQIMPFISLSGSDSFSNIEDLLDGTADGDSSSLANAEDCEAGSSGRHHDSDVGSPSTKRPKTE